MYDDDYSIETRTGEFAVTLSISLQQFLGLYTEPLEDDPATYEDEEKVYVFSADQLRALLDVARAKAAELRLDAENLLALERLGATFNEASNMFARQNGYASMSESDDGGKFYPDEDLAFMYHFVATLHGFIFTAECNLPPKEEV